MNTTTSPITFDIENFSDISETIKPLFEEEWNEVGHRKDVLPLNIDYELMSALEKMNRLRIFTVREYGILVGYMVFTVGSHPKYKDTIWAFGNGFWIMPESRKPLIAMRLLDFVTNYFKIHGVRFIQAGGRESHPAAIRILEAAGFEKYEIGLLKVI